MGSLGYSIMSAQDLLKICPYKTLEPQACPRPGLDFFSFSSRGAAGPQEVSTLRHLRPGGEPNHRVSWWACCFSIRQGFLGFSPSFDSLCRSASQVRVDERQWANMSPALIAAQSAGLRVLVRSSSKMAEVEVFSRLRGLIIF